MAKQHISQGLKKFIKEKIQTVLRLEILLLLHHQQTRSFTLAEVANELGFEKEDSYFPNYKCGKVTQLRRTMITLRDCKMPFVVVLDN